MRPLQMKNHHTPMQVRASGLYNRTLCFKTRLHISSSEKNVNSFRYFSTSVSCSRM